MSDHFSLTIEQKVRANAGLYKCVQNLGAGGNAVTFLVIAIQGPYAGCPFALKIFRKLSAPERRARFLDEAALLQQMNHPSVMRVYDEGVFHTSEGDHPFVVAEYLPSTLQQVLDQSHSISEKLLWALQLVSALSHLSNQQPQIVHRDIKPANIFIKGKSCVLGDFGLMKALDGNNEVDREIFKESMGPGMPFYYRTPDLVAYANNKADITCKSDVFQLGLVLCQLFTGWNPCQRTDDIYSQVVLSDVGHIPGALGSSIAATIKKMLNFDPSLRPSAAQLLSIWESIFYEAANTMISLEGTVF